MAKVKVYDKAGNEYLKEPIDAQECCELLGYVMELPEKEKVQEKPAIEKPKATRKPKVVAPIVTSEKVN